MTIQTWTLTMSEMSEAANIVKEMVVYTLIKKGMLSQENGQAFVEEYGLIVLERGLIGKAIDKWLFRKEENARPRYVIVKLDPVNRTREARSEEAEV